MSAVVTSLIFPRAIAIAANTPTTIVTKPSLDLVCMQDAVDARDSAIIIGVKTYGDAMLTALNTREFALKAAWGITVVKDRRATIAKAWADYRVTLKTARAAMNTARNAAWTTFNVTRKTCGTGAAADDAGTAAVDGALSEK